MTALDALMAYDRDTQALAQIQGRLGWDQETMMPAGAAEQRGEEMAALEGVLHARRTAPQLGAWLSEIEETDLDDVARAKLRHLRRDYARNTKVPARLAAEIARVTSRAQGQWAQARAAEDVAAFLPVLQEVVRLRQEEGRALAGEGDIYDALLQDYEPGTTAADLEAMFGAMRPRLVALRDRIMGASAPPPALSGSFDESAQLALSQKLALAFGYDLNHGRIDKAVHPFSSGSGADVRITTRTSAQDPFYCFYSTIHEVGHAAYEQNIDGAFALSPLGSGVSMGVHESQSRIYENQIGRSRAFTGWLYEEMTQSFGDLGMDAEAFYGCVNRVGEGYIRTEADEVQYNLHVLLRFDLERQIVSGALPVADLEEAWNARFEADFGFSVDKPSNGCLQDVHWSVGLFGYFPTYSLGNVYAGCLNAALRKDVPDLDASLARGETALATAWLREKLQRHGGLRAPRATIAHAAGIEPSEGPLLDYIEAKFSEIYGL
ncbi:MAG: carboxypeptidase M32 [Pseudomonadota bacterium]